MLPSWFLEKGMVFQNWFRPLLVSPSLLHSRIMDVSKFVFGKTHVFPKTVSASVDVAKLVFGNRSVFPKTVSATIGVAKLAS